MFSSYLLTNPIRYILNSKYGNHALVAVIYIVVLTLAVFILTLSSLQIINKGVRYVLYRIDEYLVYILSAITFIISVISTNNVIVLSIVAILCIVIPLILRTNINVVGEEIYFNNEQNFDEASALKPASGLKVIILSDIHMPEEFTLEGHVPRPKIEHLLGSILDSVLNGNDKKYLIVLLGDTTDSGKAEEWSAVFDILKIKKIKKENVVIVPGNHDVNIDVADRIWDQQKSYDQNRKVFLDSVFSEYCQNARVFLPTGETRSVADITGVTQNSCQFIQLSIKFETAIADGIWEEKLLSNISYTDNLLRELDKLKSEMLQINRSFTSYPDSIARELLMKYLYPMILQEGPEYCIIALNSCENHGTSMFSNDLGNIGRYQIVKLIQLLHNNDYIEKHKIVFIHHHVGVASGVRTKIDSHTLKLLRLQNGVDVFKVVSSMNNIKVIHGHLHCEESVIIKGCKIISVPSVCYGDAMNPSKGYLTIVI
jgi:metallophosphoesterase superfamily enzyme